MDPFTLPQRTSSSICAPHRRNVPSCVNQRDKRGTLRYIGPRLVQYDGYLEIFEYLLSEGADPTITTNDYDPYLDPGLKTPIEVAIQDDTVRDRLQFLIDKYADVLKAEMPSRSRCWWTLYDYGLDVVQKCTITNQTILKNRRRQKALEEKRLLRSNAVKSVES